MSDTYLSYCLHLLSNTLLCFETQGSLLLGGMVRLALGEQALHGNFVS